MAALIIGCLCNRNGQAGASLWDPGVQGSLQGLGAGTGSTRTARVISRRRGEAEGARCSTTMRCPQVFRAFCLLLSPVPEPGLACPFRIRNGPAAFQLLGSGGSASVLEAAVPG